MITCKCKLGLSKCLQVNENLIQQKHKWTKNFYFPLNNDILFAILNVLRFPSYRQ